MHKQMFELGVELGDDGVISITQSAGMVEPSKIFIAPEQVGIVVE